MQPRPYQGRRIDLLKLVCLYSRNRSPEPRDTLGGIVACNLVYFERIAGLVVKVGKVKPIGAVGMQLEKARSDDVIVQIYSIAANVAFSLQDGARLVGDDKMVFDKLAVEDVAGVGEEGEPARHGSDHVIVLRERDGSARLVKLTESCGAMMVGIGAGPGDHSIGPHLSTSCDWLRCMLSSPLSSQTRARCDWKCQCEPLWPKPSLADPWCGGLPVPLGHSTARQLAVDAQESAAAVAVMTSPSSTEHGAEATFFDATSRLLPCFWVPPARPAPTRNSNN